MDTRRAFRGLVGTVIVAALMSGSVLSAAAAPTAGTTASNTAVTAAACTAGSSACPIRISFAPGAYSGQGHAYLAGASSVKWFVVNARAGQTMVVIVKGRGPTRGIVYSPDGSHSGQPGGRIFDAIVPASGDQRIRVSESTMGEAWSGGVDVLVVIY